MGSKVYEASTLKAATRERAHQYETLREQFESLKKEFGKIVDNGEFQGHGAVAIKGFYQAQIDVVDAWIRFIDVNVEFLKGIPGDTEGADLSGDTVIQVPLLEESVGRAGRTAKDRVADQQEALQNIFNGINDLVSLSVFSKDAFDDQMDQAEKKRSQTIEKVHTLDQQLSQEYAISQNQEQHIYGLFAQMMEATRQGEKISPLYFNSEAYHNSDVYKAIGQAEEETSKYLTIKKEQQESREIAKKMEEMENRPWYEKGWDMACTFTGEVTGYYDTIRASTGVDPVTGRKLSNAERIAAGGMAAAGFIPVIGWGGRIAKGGNAVFKTVKGMNAADNMLDAYKTTKGLSNLQKAEFGIYGLVSANGFGEYFTGKDMFGNELTEEQRNQSLFNAFAIVGAGGAGYALNKVDVGKVMQTKFPYSTKYAQQQVAKAQELLKTVKTSVGNTQIPVRFRVEEVAVAGGRSFKTIATETKTLRELMQQASVTRGTGNLINTTRMNEIEVRFKQNSRHNTEEFIRQLKDQEKGLNNLTIEDYLNNRDRYLKEGRALEGNAAQRLARQEALKEKVLELRKQGLSRHEANEKAEKWLETQAALHNPDQIAGGNPHVIEGMGDKRINSSIGSQWKYRIDIIDEEIRGIAEKLSLAERRSTYLNIKLTH